MKSVKMSAKMFLAMAAVACVSLTSCEKEDFNVDVPNINFPGIEFPEVNQQSGSVYVMLTASDTNGKLLNNVEFTAPGQTVSVSGDMIVITGKDKVSLTVTASKDGYLSETKTFDVTPMLNQLISLPVNFVLSTVEVEDVPVVEGVAQPNAGTTSAEIQLPAPSAGFVAGTYTAKVQVPTQAPFLNAEQKAALLSAIDKLQDPATRGAAEDLQVAKEMLRAKVASYSTKPETKEQTHEFTLTEDAKSVSIVLTSETASVAITMSTTVNEKTYSVEGSYTIYTKTVISAEADGVEIGHGHGHGHGDDANAGGGTGNGQA